MQIAIVTGAARGIGHLAAMECLAWDVSEPFSARDAITAACTGRASAVTGQMLAMYGGLWSTGISTATMQGAWRNL
jgi:hypothetical protein